MNAETKQKHCARCGEAVVYAAEPAVRFRVFHPETGRELILLVHKSCRRRFVSGAESVLLSNV